MNERPPRDDDPQRRRRDGDAIWSRATRIIWGLAAVGLVATLAAYGLGWTSHGRGGGSAAAKKSTTGSRGTVMAVASATPVRSPTPSPQATPVPKPTLTAAQLTQYKPNELGQVMVLMYHGIDDGGDEYSTTAAEFRADLEWLYSHDFYVIPIHDYITDQIKAPAGKRPVVLTFDDGTVNQFRYIVDASGKKTVDPDSAIGILEAFFAKHPDFGRGGLFSILPLAPFAWPDTADQQQYAGEKIQWLVDHGYEIGNHTVDHANLRELSDDEIKAQLGDAVDKLTAFAPAAKIEVIAVPFGVYPAHGDTTLFEGFDRNGKHYAFSAALMVGANPAPSPVDKEFDPYWIPRIRATKDELPKWFDFVESNPGMIYVSDGNPDTIAVPNQLPSGLAGSLDDAKAKGKTVIRY